jgi:hypothetical protein
MAGSSRNSDRRNDNSYPSERKPKAKTLRERAGEAVDRISRAMDPRTYLEAPAQRQMNDANRDYGGGARSRRRMEAVDEAVTGKPAAQRQDGRRSRR